MEVTAPTTVWRLVSDRYRSSAFDGEGARLYGGRWNHTGTSVVYTAATLSLAVLELLVHLEVEDVPVDRVALAAELPAGLAIERLEVADLPDGWRRYPASETLKDLGTEWVASGRTAVLQVPSAVVPREANFLLNPAHPDMARITVHPAEPFSFDPRLVKSADA